MLISIYMPTRNRMRDLQSAIYSVKVQTFKNWELIVVDDASTDNTSEMMSQLCLGDSRITYLRNDKALGAPFARNRAIKLARGEYLTGLDDDDCFQPQRLEMMCERWQEASSRASISGIYSQDNIVVNGKKVAISQKKGSATFQDLLSENGIGNQIFAPAKHFIDVGMFDESLPAWQDLDLFLRMTRRFGAAKLIDAALYDFDMSPAVDRISAKEERVRIAFEMVSKKYVADRPRAQQLLMLQLFSGYYGYSPSLQDFSNFMSKGFWPIGLLRMAKGNLRAIKRRFKI